jgi:CelD/BcsL family acetyltransferase involved in cellulose biosynthesis
MDWCGGQLVDLMLTLPGNDFTLGDHPYKQQFGAQSVPLHAWQAARTIRGHLALLGMRMAREAKRVLKPIVKDRLGWSRN